MKWDTTKKLQTEFLLKDKEVPEKEYWDMMEALPPEAMVQNAFLVGEPQDHEKDLSGHFGARYSLYFRDNEKHYFGGYASISDFKTFIINSN